MVCFINRLANGVIDRFLAGFVDRTPDGVVDRALVFLVYRLANRIVDRPCSCLVLRNHHCVIDVSSCRFRNKSTALHLTVFVINFISRAIASLLDAIVYGLSHRTHASVSSACHWGRRHFTTISGFPASTTALIADRAAICSARGICTGHDRTDHDGGYDPQPIHLDFSTGNNTSVARRSFGEYGASAPISRHRSPCLFLDARLGNQTTVRLFCLDSRIWFA